RQPGGEGVGAGGRDLEVAPGGQLHDPAPQAHDLLAHLGGRLADVRADLDDRLVELRLHLLAQDQLPLLEQLGDVRAQLARLGIDDLVLFFDSDVERRLCWHGQPPYSRLATTNTGTVEPPPAVTLSSAAVERRLRQPST